MSKKYFEDEKLQYENVEIPEELDFVVKNTLKEGRRRRNVKRFCKLTSGIVASFFIFIFLVNMFPKIAYAASLIPGIDKLVELVRFDKGFINAVDKGLTKELNYVEEKDGVKLIVNGLAGDYKRLWISYELIGMDDYIVDAKFISKNTGKEIEAMIGYNGYNGEKIENSYLEVGFLEFVEEFNLELKVSKKEEHSNKIELDEEKEKKENEFTFSDEDKSKSITTFIVPIILEREIFGNLLKEVKIDNKLISTEVGDIIIDKFETSKTRISMKFEFESEEYDFMGFDNPKVIDDKGNEYITSSFYSSKDINGDNYLELEGELYDDVKELKFVCDGVYYAKKDNRKVKINLKDGYVEENYYGVKFISFNNNNNRLTLETNNIKGLTFESIVDIDGEYIISTEGSSCMGNDEQNIYQIISYMKVGKEDLGEIELEISSVLKDKTKRLEVNLIKK